MPKAKQTNTRRFITLLTPNNPIKGVIIFAISFMAIGGGYMAYKSFAYTYVKNASQILSAGDAYTTNACNNSKSCITAWVVVNNTGSIYTTFNNAPAPVDLTFYHICALARLPEDATGYASLKVAAFIGSTNIGTGGGNVVPSGSYQSVCVNTKDLSLLSGGYDVKVKMYYNTSVTQHTSRNVLVSSFTLEQLADGPF